MKAGSAPGALGKGWHLAGTCRSCGSGSRQTQLPGLAAIPGVIPGCWCSRAAPHPLCASVSPSAAAHWPFILRKELPPLVPTQRSSSRAFRGEALGVVVRGCATAKPPAPSLLLGGSENSGFDGRRALFTPATSRCGRMLVSLCRVFALGHQGSVWCVLWLPESSPFPAENYLGWRAGTAGKGQG